MERIVDCWQKNSRETLQTEIKEFKGKTLISLRIYVEDQATGNKFPTKKGLSLSIDCFDKLKASIEKLEAALKEENLIAAG